MASKGEIVYPVDPHGESLAGLLPRGNVGGGGAFSPAFLGSGAGFRRGLDTAAATSYYGTLGQSPRAQSVELVCCLHILLV